jgi:hypothetical protein
LSASERASSGSSQRLDQERREVIVAARKHGVSQRLKWIVTSGAKCVPARRIGCLGVAAGAVEVAEIDMRAPVRRASALRASSSFLGLRCCGLGRRDLA